MKTNKKVIAVMSVVAVALLGGAVSGYAYTPAPLVTSTDLEWVSNFGADAKLTMPVVWAAVIPVTMSVYMMRAAVNSGLKKVRHSIGRF